MIRTCRTSTVVTLVAAVVLWLLPTASAGGTAQHAAGLVVDTGDRVVTVYVPFPDGRETITGEELLQRADVDAVFSDEYGMGKAVCSILGVGSPQDDCFREAERQGLYWNYSRAEDGEWRRSNKGVSSTTVEHGDVDGWAWGGQGSQPPYHTFEEIRDQHEPEPSGSASSEASPGDGSPPQPQQEPPAETDEDPAPDGEDEPEAADTPADAPAAVVTSPAETEAEPTSEPTAVEEASPTLTPTPTPAPSEEAVPVAVEEELAGTPRGLLSLLTFAVVMAVLAGAIVWRRRAGTHEGPRAP